MTEQLNSPNMGYVDDEHLGDAPYDSDHSTDISPGQYPRSVPASFASPQTKGGRKIWSGRLESSEGNPPHHPQADRPHETNTRPPLPAPRHHGLNEFKDEPIFGDGPDHEEDEKRTPRLIQGRSNTYTFDAPTKSSRAKQNEKVELPPTVRKTSVMNKTQPSRSRSVRHPRRLFADIRGGPLLFGTAASVNGSKYDDEKTLSDKSVEDVDRSSDLDVNSGQIIHPRQRSRSLDTHRRLVNIQRRSSLAAVDRSQESPRPTSLRSLSGLACNDDATCSAAVATNHGEHNVEVRGYFDEDHVVISREQLDTLRDQLDFAQLQHMTAQRELQLFQNKCDMSQQDLQIVQCKCGLLGEQLQSVQDEQEDPQQESLTLLKNHKQLQQEYATLNHNLQDLEQRIATCYLRKRAPDTLESALDEIALLQVAGMDVKKAEKDSEDANAEAGQIYDELTNLQDDMRFLEVCVEDKSRSVLGDATDSGPIRSRIQERGFAPGAKEYAASLLQLFVTFDQALGTLTEANNQLQKQLVVEQRLSRYLGERKKSADTDSSLSFQKLYEEEQGKRKTLEANLKEFQDLAVGSMDPELKIENAKLKDGLAKYHRRTIVPRLQAGIYQVSARLWQEEAEGAKEELSKRTIAFQKDHDAQTKEMRMYIEEYHSKTKDEAHWKLQDLQAKITTLERDLCQTNKFFGKTKRDKARLEEKFARLQAKMTKKEKVIEERLMYRGGDYPIPSPVPDLDREDASSNDSGSSSPRSWLGTPDFRKRPPPYPPRFIWKQEQCRVEMIHFRQKQEKRRVEEDNDLEEILEKLRKYRMDMMGVKYPPSKGNDWDTMKEKGSWDRWDGEGWRREVKFTVTEERVMRGLKERKLLGTKEKPRK